MNNPLDGKVVWVTGSARRVGRVIALECARAGADVVVHCKTSRAGAETVVHTIREMGRRALLVQGDHADRAAVRAMVRQIDNEFGALSALVNNASVFNRKPFEEMGDEDFQQSLSANLTGPFICIQESLPLLRRSSPAHIVNILDANLSRPHGFYSAYFAAKGGLDALTRALAKELAPGILVNSVSPGPVLEPEDMDAELRAKTIRRVLLKRWGRPEDVAAAVVHLISSNYLTGVDIPVDGGRRLG